MGKTLFSFLVVIGLEVGVTSNDSSSHQVEVFTQTGVPSLCYSSCFEDVARLIDTGVSATESDEVLVALKAVDGSNFSKEVCCRNFTNTRDTGDDLHLFILSLSHQRYQGLSQLIETLLEEQQVVCTVSDQRTIGSDTNRLISQLSQLFNGECNSSSASFWRFQGQSQLFVSSLLCILSTRELSKKSKHCLRKYIVSKQFWPSYSEIGLKLSFYFSYIFSNLLSSSCNAQSLVVHSSLVNLPLLWHLLGVASNQLGVNLVSLGLPQGASVAKLFDQYWVNDSRSVPILQEVMGQRDVVATGRLHEQVRGFKVRGSLKQRIKSISIHRKRTVDDLDFSVAQNTERGVLLGNVDTDDGTHHRTSLGGVERLVPNSISRLIEARWLNQPIGVLGTEGQTPYEAQRLNKHVALSAPNNNILKSLSNIRTIYT